MSFDLSFPGRRQVGPMFALWLAGALVLAGLAAPAAAQLHPRGQPVGPRPWGEPMGYEYYGYYGPMMAGHSNSPAGRSTGLQPLVKQLSDQFWFAYRANVPVYRMCQDELRKAIEAWNGSPQTAEDRQMMVKWLRDSMTATMPGAPKPLPSIPKFSGSTESSEEAPPAETAVPATPQSTTSNKPVVPDAVPEPTSAGAENEEDYWFSETSETAPSNAGKNDSDEFWSGYSDETKPLEDSSPDDNPFGDDPQGL